MTFQINCLKVSKEEWQRTESNGWNFVQIYYHDNGREQILG